MKLRLPAPQFGRFSSSSGTRQGHDVDRDGSAPLEEVVDEVEQARVGEVEVLEDQDDRGCRREPLEERPPGPEQLLRGAPLGLDPEQGQQGRLDPAALVRVRDVLRDGRRDAGPGRRLVIGPRAGRPAGGPSRRGPRS